jgi:hypothetical protein
VDITTAFTTANVGYNVTINSATFDAAGDTSFLNTGTVTLGNGAADVLTFAGGLNTTGAASNPTTVNAAGTIRALSDRVDLGNLLLTGDLSLIAPAGQLHGPVTRNGFDFTISFSNQVQAPVFLPYESYEEMVISTSRFSGPIVQVTLIDEMVSSIGADSVAISSDITLSSALAESLPQDLNGADVIFGDGYVIRINEDPSCAAEPCSSGLESGEDEVELEDVSINPAENVSFNLDISNYGEMSKSAFPIIPIF